MPSVCFYFQVHQPMRIRRYRVFDIGRDSQYFNDASGGKLNNKKIIEKVAGKCYLPANAVLLELLNKHPEFKVSFSLSGIFLEQLERYSPETLRSFQKLTETGRVEILSETYYHSLSFLYSKDEFKRQVEMHKKKIKALFGVIPTIFRNTELIYNNELAKIVEEMGYKGILAEGADHILGWRSPNFLYQPVGTKKIKVLLKNYRLSDDIAFRFSSRDWSEWPLSASKFAHWVSQVNGGGNVVNLFMDYETFGEHQWEDTGIFNFLRALPEEIYRHPDNNFVTPSEAVDKYESMGELDVHHFVSWADVERDTSAWLSNSMQWEVAAKLYELESSVLATKDIGIIHDWRRLQTSDHLYYMCTKWFNDGDVHKYFNPYDSPYDAFISFMNALNDLKLRINRGLSEITPKTGLSVKKVLK
ncbi:glycoside hydrolase family 57 protein [bacterium]|nr:glycoside hydrolase family 57 protein [bacterium]